MPADPSLLIAYTIWLIFGIVGVVYMLVLLLRRWQAARAATALSNRFVSAEARAKQTETMIRDKRPHIRIVAAAAVPSLIADQPKLAGPLIDLIVDASPEVRATAAKSIASTGKLIQAVAHIQDKYLTDWKKRLQPPVAWLASMVFLKELRQASPDQKSYEAALLSGWDGVWYELGEIYRLHRPTWEEFQITVESLMPIVSALRAIEMAESVVAADCEKCDLRRVYDSVFPPLIGNNPREGLPDSRFSRSFEIKAAPNGVWRFTQCVVVVWDVDSHDTICVVRTGDNTYRACRYWARFHEKPTIRKGI